MVDTSHTIQIQVDASKAQAGLNALRTSIRDTGRELQSLGASAGGSSFTNLSRGLSSLSSGFESLRRQTSQDSGLSNLSREISLLSRGMPVAAREIVALGSAFIVSRNAIALFAGALGSVGIGKFASDALATGNSFMSLRMAIDSSAESSREVGNQLKFLFGLADSTGSRVEDLTNNFRNLDAAMRSSGASVADVQKVTKAFATISSVLHLTSADAKTVIREIGETFSMGAAHATQVTRSIATHIPGMVGLIKEAMHMSGEEIRKTFQKGGFDPNVLWPAVADTILQKYSTQLPEAMNHAQASMNGLANAWTKLKLSTFDNGLDQAITQLSKHLTGLATDSAIESVGRTFGTAFRMAAAGVTILVDQIIAAKEPLAAFFGAFAVVPAVRIAMMGLGAAFAFATSPITILATLAAVTAANWDKLKNSFGGSESIFSAVAGAIANTVARLFDLNKAFKGALELYALGKSLLSGNGWSASLDAARQAGADFDAHAKQSGQTFAQSWFDGAKGTLDSAAKWLEGRFAGVTGEYNTRHNERNETGSGRQRLASPREISLRPAGASPRATTVRPGGHRRRGSG